jgi:hypothetical protein
MKKIITLIFMFYALSTTIIAQKKTVIMSNDKQIAKKSFDAKSGVLIVNPDLDNFVGTWEGKKGNEILTLMVTKIITNIGSSEKSFEVEMLNGGYKLLIDGNVSINTLATKPLYSYSVRNSNGVVLVITNYKKNTKTAINVIMIDKNTIKLEPFKLKEEGIRADPDFYIPLNIILKKKQ